MASKRDRLLDKQVGQIARQLSAWVLGGLVEDHGGYLSIECLRAVVKVAAELKASGIIGEIAANDDGGVKISFESETRQHVVINVSLEGDVRRIDEE